MQAGTLHRTRLRAANGSPPSASTSLTKGGGPSTPAAEWAGKAKRLAARLVLRVARGVLSAALLAGCQTRRPARRMAWPCSGPTAAVLVWDRERFGPSRELDELGRLGAPPPSDLGKHNKATRAGREQLPVSALFVAPSLAEGSTFNRWSPGPKRGWCQRQAARRPKANPLAMTFFVIYAPVIKLLDMDIQVRQKGVSCAGLPANSGRARPRVGGEVVTKRIQSTPTHTPGSTQRQRDACMHSGGPSASRLSGSQANACTCAGGACCVSMSESADAPAPREGGEAGGHPRRTAPGLRRRARIFAVRDSRSVRKRPAGNQGALWQCSGPGDGVAARSSQHQTVGWSSCSGAHPSTAQMGHAPR